MEEPSSECAAERGGTRDLMAVTGVREGFSGWGNMLLSRADRVVAADWSLHRLSPPPPALLSHMIPALVLRTSEMESGSLFGLDHLKRQLWAGLPWRPLWYPWSSAPGHVEAQGS